MAVPNDPATERRRRPGGPSRDQSTNDDANTARRRATVAAAGHRGDVRAARLGLTDAEGAVRAAALGALARCADLCVADVIDALGDPSAVVRRRAAAESPSLRGPGSRSALVAALRRAVDDADSLVAETACWALGERRARAAVGQLAGVAHEHPNPVCREAAVAALGAIGDPAGLPAVSGALDDRPAVRRRAVVALAAFRGPTADAALRRCLDDRDWQVRQSAEILLGI